MHLYKDNAEIQRRCQEVINACTYQKDNPIVSIHDIGAGGLCNAVPEIVNDFGMGAIISFDNVSNAEESMTSLEIWCNESQERYVIIIREKDLAELQNICTRENCPMYNRFCNFKETPKSNARIRISNRHIYEIFTG